MRAAAAPVLPGLALLLAWACAALLAKVAAEGPLAKLDAARERRAELAALADRSPQTAPPLLARDQMQRAANRAAAIRALTATVRATGARAGVLVERAEPLPKADFPTPLVAVRVVASGSEKALLTFVSDIERARPAIRFVTWRLGRVGELDATPRLDARAVAVMDASR